ncbi:uncharacterized protein LOC135496833 [Lineus longissimus]|uniref:uncharacterized protein LOC135496833 n=1 Tax=Lineus longissimus TaxID=88925 RepID=UPI00315D8C7B
MNGVVLSGVNVTETGQSDELVGLRQLFLHLTNYLWVPPVVFGIPGNIMSLLVANRSHNKDLSPCVYITAMAVADTLFLVSMAWFRPVIQMTLYFSGLGEEIPHLREYLYKYHWFITATTSMMSGLFLAEMSLDRLIAVRFPMSAARLCNKSRTRKIIAITTILVTLFNLNTFVTHKHARNRETGDEDLFLKVEDYPIVEHVVSSFEMIFGAFLPFVIISCSNFFIIITVQQAVNERRKMELQGEGDEDLYIHVEDYPILEPIVSNFQLVFGALLPFVAILSSNVVIIITVRLASKERRKMELQGEALE